MITVPRSVVYYSCVGHWLLLCQGLSCTTVVLVTGDYCPKRCDVERRCCSDWDEGRRAADDTGREEASGGGVGEGCQGQVSPTGRSRRFDGRRNMYSAWPRPLVYFLMKSGQL